VTIRPLPLLWLVVVWLTLWESLTVANVLSGLVVGALLLRLFPIRPERTDRPRFRPVAIARLLGHFAVQLVRANLAVAWEVITPNNDAVREGIVAVPLAPSSDSLLAMVCNMFSLTPGTLVIDIEQEPPVIYVHVLHFRSIPEVRSNFRGLQRMVLRAFGSDEAIAAGVQRLEALEQAEVAEAMGAARADDAHGGDGSSR
jgi:multicomponent Na+:H+ antiporter subunit E